MGQRLVVEMMNQGKAVANAYYHWAGYTGSSAKITDIIIGELNNVSEIDTDPTRKAVSLLYATGAKISQPEWDQAVTEGLRIDGAANAVDNDANRNDGLICVSQTGMQENKRWAEALVEIDMMTGEIMFDAYCYEFAEDWDEEDTGVTLDSMPVFDMEYQITTENWNQFYENLTNTLARSNYAITPNKEIVYEFIE